MLQLVSPDKVRTRTGMGSLSVAAPYVQSALTAAQLRIEAELESVFTQADYVDTFFLDSSIQGAQENGLWKLRLSSGFVRASPMLGVSYGAQFNAANIYDVLGGDFRADFLRGIVRLSSSVTGYATVSYTAGFVKADIPDNIPDWLVDGIIGYYPLVANFSQIADRPSDLETLTTLNVQHALAVIAPYRRPSDGLYPL